MSADKGYLIALVQKSDAIKVYGKFGAYRWPKLLWVYDN